MIRPTTAHEHTTAPNSWIIAATAVEACRGKLLESVEGTGFRRVARTIDVATAVKTIRETHRLNNEDEPTQRNSSAPTPVRKRGTHSPWIVELDTHYTAVVTVRCDTTQLQVILRAARFVRSACGNSAHHVSKRPAGTQCTDAASGTNSP